MERILNLIMLVALLSGCSIGAGEDETESNEIAEVIATEKTFPSATRESAPDVSFLIEQATNQEQYRKLWKQFDFQESAPNVNFDEKNVLFFYLTEPDSCPRNLSGKDIQVNPNTEALNIELSTVIDTDAGCTADSTPRTFVIEITQNVGPFDNAVVYFIDGEYTVPIN